MSDASNSKRNIKTDLFDYIMKTLKCKGLKNFYSRFGTINLLFKTFFPIISLPDALIQYHTSIFLSQSKYIQDMYVVCYVYLQQIWTMGKYNEIRQKWKFSFIHLV